jgi:broad specificity phosphatase PhoE
MSTLVLIRHGQAASYAHGADELSEIGRRQAHKLGEYFVRTGATFDAVYSGDLLRQQETAKIVAAAYERAGKSFPAIETVVGWNEYDASGVTGALVPVLAEADADFAQKVQDFQAAIGTREHNRYFQRMFEVVMGKWVRDEITAPGVEAFSTFHRRVSDAHATIVKHEASRRVAVFSSGGPIGACVQLVMQAPLHMAMEINWRVRNTSISEFLYSRDRISLDSFNTVPHIDEPDLLTFR